MRNRRNVAAIFVAVVVLMGIVAGASGGLLTRETDSVAIWRVHVDGKSDIDRLVASGADLVEGRGADYLLVVGEDTVAAALRVKGFRVTEDRRLAKIAPTGRVMGPNGPATALAATFYGGYRTVDEQYAHLASVAAAYPGLATTVDYGDSWRKTRGLATGNDLMAICLTNRQAGDCQLSPTSSKPRAVIMAAIHARELQTSELAWRLIDTLTAEYATNPDIALLMNTTETWIVPVVNPDGREIVETGGNNPYLQRKNANDSAGICSNPPTSSNHFGVDLNRNANYLWGGVGTSTNPCDQTYKGVSAASEPEESALETLFRQLWPDQHTTGTTPVASTAQGTFITLHSYGNLVLLPPGASATLTPNDVQLRALAFRMSHFNGYVTGTGPETLYPTSGTTDDWAYFRLGVAGFTFEVSPTSGTCSGFTPVYTCIDSTLWPLNRSALLYSIRVAGAPYSMPRGPTTTSVTVPSSVAPTSSFALGAVVNDNAYGTAAGSVSRPTAQTVTAAEYFLDVQPGGPGTGTPLAASDGAFSATSETVGATLSTAGLSLGAHRVYVRGRNTGGSWGPVSAGSFIVADVVPPTTLFSDDFTSGAANWSALDGTAVWSLVTVTSNQKYQGSASKQSTTGQRVAGTASWTNYSVRADTVTTTKRSTNRGPGILARVVDANNHYRFSYTSGGRWAIEKVSSGTVTLLAQSVATTLTTNTTYSLRADVNGSELSFYVNEALVAKATDTTFTAGRIGLRVYGTISQFDNVTVVSP